MFIVDFLTYLTIIIHLRRIQLNRVDIFQ